VKERAARGARERIEAGIAKGLHAGAQLYASRAGEPLVDLAIGEARVGVPLARDALTLWMSSCKPITAVAIAQLWERGEIDLDAAVADYIPEFAQGGKAAVRLRHVLTHTAGFRATPFQYPRDDWETSIAKLAMMPLEPGWVPGERAGYHVHSAWFILGELVERISGMRLRQYLRARVLEPSGMRDSWVGMPLERYSAYADRLSVMMDTSAQPARPLEWHTQGWVTGDRPSGNAYGPARELGAFYEMLLRGGAGPDGARVLERETVDLFTRRHRTGMTDRTFKAVLDWGLGFILDSKRHGEAQHPYGYGPHASDATFGHSGYQSSTGFADPERELAVALVFNGCPGDAAHQERVHEVLGALYEDLGLTR
jgi:CubicO group peptidase (beta-lactamase class C family)